MVPKLSSVTPLIVVVVEGTEIRKTKTLPVLQPNSEDLYASSGRTVSRVKRYLEQSGESLLQLHLRNSRCIHQRIPDSVPLSQPGVAGQCIKVN
ncbi:unnamed protein product [Allacma fusca]|uniref:Uncharacterized protein n=1 Tax=Allacma fusca TaxID=39272 RepID=A0A8J2JXT4_9HEXA|nr:unnamed protein product [Allacma fusca]